MAMFTDAEVVLATGARILQQGRRDMLYRNVTTDTRTVGEDDLFAALKGEKFDGHDFIEQAVSDGAAGVIVEDAARLYPDGDYTIFVVKNTRKAYQDLALFHRRRFSIPVVAVTGSAGKTSTRALIATVLEQKYNVLQTEKNFNNEIGLPRTLLQLTKEHGACVVELGMRGLGQIKELADIAEPTVGVVTNVGKSHIELLGSQAQIARAKGELVEALGSDGTAEVTVGVRLKPVPRRLTLIDVETKNFVEASTAVFLDGKPVAFSAAVSGAGSAGLYEYELRIRGRVREEALNGAAERCAALAAMTYMLEGDTAPTRLAFSGDGVALSGMKQRSEGTRSGGCDAGLGALALILAAVYLLRRIGCSA